MDEVACGLVVMLTLTTCSVKRALFEGVPGDAALLHDAKSAGDDPPPIEDALLVAAADAPADDAAVPTDAPSIDAPPDATIDARSCAELRDAGMPSGVYWVRPTDTSERFQVYCEQRQELNGGGWAMVLNSVRREDGTTTAFWQLLKDDRLKERGTLAPDQNYYNGALYVIGREYMDVFVDLQGKLEIAVVMTATGIVPTTMRFIAPTRISGNAEVYNHQFASGWSAQDFDGDDHPTVQCAVFYSNVAQHYGGCWLYNLGSDADAPFLDGGVGPHVENAVLTSLGLSLQSGGGRYSQVRRIARFTRW